MIHSWIATPLNKRNSFVERSYIAAESSATFIEAGRDHSVVTHVRL
jgi:hypothetical protein